MHSCAYHNVYFDACHCIKGTTLTRATGAGATILDSIEEMPWGERLFYAHDPFGNPLSFVDDRTLFTGT
jgi:predicted enzyme related to lactoylglutathione lyase